VCDDVVSGYIGDASPSHYHIFRYRDHHIIRADSNAVK
jgi:hypothetical protein